MATQSREIKRELKAAFPSTPFEGASVETLFLQFQEWSDNDEEHFFCPYEGFSSMALHNLMRSLSSECSLCDRLKQVDESNDAQRLILDYVYSSMANGEIFNYWDDIVLEKAANLMLFGEEHPHISSPWMDLPLFKNQRMSA